MTTTISNAGKKIIENTDGGVFLNPCPERTVNERVFVAAKQLYNEFFPMRMDCIEDILKIARFLKDE